MSAGNSIERVRMLEALGAQVTRVPQVDGEPGRVTGADIAAADVTARAFAAERAAFYVDQFHNPAVARAHEEGTGPELWAAVRRPARRLRRDRRYWRHLRRHQPPPQAHVAGTALLRCRARGHAAAGRACGDRRSPPAAGRGLRPRAAAVGPVRSSMDAGRERRRGRRECAGALGAEEGLYVGYSAAANVAAALQLFDCGIVCAWRARWPPCCCDTGLKYGLPG